MAIYLGSELVNFNTAHDVKQYAYWIGGSWSVSYKSNSTKKSGIANAVVYAPEGCSIYASQVITGSSARTYSSASATSIFYQMRGYVYGDLCDIVSAPVYNCSQYYSQVIHSKTNVSTSSMFIVGAAVNAFAITDTIIKDSTLMYSRSTGVQSFFTGIITPFTKVNASLLQTVPSRAFNHRSELTAVNFPMCTTIEEFAFYFCKSLATISFPVCTSIGYSAFYNCPSLTIANFPMCTTIGDSAFEVCSELTAISFPACTTIGNSAFKACYSLATISFPVCTSIGSYAFCNCLSLTAANFPVCTTIGNSAFASCYNLISLNLTNVSSVPILSGASAFSDTPIGGYSGSAGQFGSIYVPASLYSDFLTAENWSDVSSRIVSV